LRTEVSIRENLSGAYGGWFLIEYRLVGEIYQTDRSKPDRKLWQADYDRLCRKVDALVFQPIMGPSRFFTLGWKPAKTEVGIVEEPAVFLCEFTSDKGKPYIKVHEDFTELVNEAKSWKENHGEKMLLVTHALLLGGRRPRENRMGWMEQGVNRKERRYVTNAY